MTIDFRNPAHIKRIVIVFAVIALIALVAVRYISASGGGGSETDVLKSAKDSGIGEVLSVTDSALTKSGSSMVSASSSEAVSANGAVGTGSDDVLAVPITDDIYVDIGGAVKKALVTKLPYGSRVNDAIEAAGGLSKNADITYINRAAVLMDGDRVYIPTKSEVKSGEPLPESAGSITAGSGSSGSSGVGSGDGSTGNSGSGNSSGTDAKTGADGGATSQSGVDNNSKININTADSTTLQILNGVGPATAEKIIDYRTQHGSFKKIEEIKNVSGIGDKTFEKLKDKITV